MPPRGRGRGGTGAGRSSAVIGKQYAMKGTKKHSVRGGAKKGRVNLLPDPPRILGIKARKSELNVSFKIIGSHQKAALLALAQKSLDAVNKDITFHENVPEFREVCRGIDEQLACVMLKLQLRRRYEEEVAQRILEANTHIINQSYKLKIEDLKEEAIAKIQEKALYIDKLSRVDGCVEEIAFQGGEDGRKVTKLPPPPKIVHPVVIPFFKGQLADEKCIHKSGDNYFEQHPANFWISCTEAQKKAISSQQVCLMEANRKSILDGTDRNRSATANSLFNPSAIFGLDTEGDEDDVQPDDPSVLQDNAGLDEINQNYELSEDAAELRLDPYGVRIPRKKIRASNRARPNNHMVVPRVFDFEDAEGKILEDGSTGIQEIGFRTWTTRKNVRNRDYYIGSNTSPNPEYFYIPQRVGEINSGNNTLEDMRTVAHIAQAHKLHPTLGIVLPGSINPNYDEIDDPYFPPPTNKNSPLGPLKIHMVIQENSDKTNTVSKIQRSWIRQCNADFEDVAPRKRLGALLKITGDHTEPKPEPQSPKLENESGTIDKDLLTAVMDALDETRNDHIVVDSGKTSTKQSVEELTPRLTPQKAPSKAPSKTPFKAPKKAFVRPSRLQYDPVRDSILESNARSQTSQIFNPISTLKSRPPDGRMLNELAEYALTYSQASHIPSSVQRDETALLSHFPPAHAHSNLPPHPHMNQSPAIQPSTKVQPQQIWYQDKPNSLQTMNHLIHNQPTQGMVHHLPQNQSIITANGGSLPAFSRQPALQASHPPYLSSQWTYNPHLPPTKNYALQNFSSPTHNPNSLSAESFNPHLPSLNHHPWPLQASGHDPQSTLPVMYISQTTSQASQSLGIAEVNSNFRDLRPTSSQQPSPAPTPVPTTYSWRIGADFHPHP
ncbi:hypothetical protein GcM1_245127 [Golovinomyces cichoracearum]|uniref:Uncharacterized protein n=1 Tax=Golovinomyces cichoracearum TaxID=62708 RepID=A0A420IFA4_9PEZI|nr:hypothetical protein GcM1_245127 [Golovinomyces cichoracearum]